jgi:hypothetical protein
MTAVSRMPTKRMICARPAFGMAVTAARPAGIDSNVVPE